MDEGKTERGGEKEGQSVRQTEDSPKYRQRDSHTEGESDCLLTYFMDY